MKQNHQGEILGWQFNQEFFFFGDHWEAEELLFILSNPIMYTLLPEQTQSYQSN